MIRINDIIDKITEYHPQADLDIIKRAYIYSARVHEGQVRLSGEPYLSHPLEVAGILSDMKLDDISVAASLLHDVIEDTHAVPEDIERLFGTEVLQIVSGVTKLSNLSFHSSKQRQAESLRKMFLAMADDIRVIMIKLADRLHNMRTLQFHKPNKRMEIARETLDIYAPIAARLGIYWIKNELEETSFKYLQPDEFTQIQTQVAKSKTERAKYMETVKSDIQKKMDEANLRCDVLGRNKNYYSIYNKMLSQNLPFEEIYDIIAFRIILDSISNCYEALGFIHSMWKPIDHKFKDYIARPKANMYQSLHTTVFGPAGQRMEVQIRTEEMHRVAEEGIAAHWKYKEGKASRKTDDGRFGWLRQMLEWQKELKDSNEFMSSVKVDLFPEEVYVFTPNGDVKELPKESTPIDFAYSIHSDVGHRCSGAKVNGRIVPLSAALNSGDSVEIITVKEGGPSRDWLSPHSGYVTTSRARNRIRHWFKQQDHDQHVHIGRDALDREVKRLSVPKPDLDDLAKRFSFHRAEDLLAAIGQGEVSAIQVANAQLQRSQSAQQPDADAEIRAKVRKKKAPQADSAGNVVVHGVGDLMTHMARCCKPVPYDPIIGYITRGRGVTVHREDCRVVQRMDEDNRARLIDVVWADAQDQSHFMVDIQVLAQDRKGLLRDISSVFANVEIDVLGVNTQSDRRHEKASMRFTVEVSDMTQLSRVMGQLAQIPDVFDVRRQV